MEKSIEKEAQKIQKGKSDSWFEKSHRKSYSKGQKNEKCRIGARQELVKFLMPVILYHNLAAQ
jgi:hypothetical protein